jgi:capsid assembly protease
MTTLIHIMDRLNQPLLMEHSAAAALTQYVALRASGQINDIHANDIAAVFGKTKPLSKDAPPYAVQNSIAILPIDGTLAYKTSGLQPECGMTGYNGIQARLAAANADQSVLGIMIQADSGGGEVSGVHEAAQAIANSAKPVRVHADRLAASAMYWLGSQASHFSVSKSATIGSIGVYTEHTDLSAALDKAGIKKTPIFSGASKADGSPYAAPTKEFIAATQNRVDAIRQEFAAEVAKGRGLSIETVLATEAKTYRGAQAVDAGLADAVMTFDQAMKDFSTQLTVGQHNTKGDLMSNDGNRAEGAVSNGITAEGMAQAVAAARAEGVSTERARINSILTLDSAKGREGLAIKMALKPAMDAEMAADLLGDMPVAASVNQASKDGQTMLAKMAAEGAKVPAIGADLHAETANLHDNAVYAAFIKSGDK